MRAFLHRCFILTTIITALIHTAPAMAHELEANRVTLILRDDIHLNIVFRINYLAYLHQKYAHEITFNEFILRFAGMKEEDFDKLCTQAEQQFSIDTKIETRSGEQLQLDHWKWPSHTKALSRLRDYAMQLIIEPDAHIDIEFSEIQAQGVKLNGLKNSRFRLPSHLGNTLVVHYTAHQQWYDNEKGHLQISFQ
jgi:hypothetical protein